jgi:hypothetical protein
VHYGAADKRITNFESNWTPAPIVKETLVGLIAGHEIRIRIVRAYVFLLFPGELISLPLPASNLSLENLPMFTHISLRFPIANGPNRRFRILHLATDSPCLVVIGSVIETNTVTIATGIFNNGLPVVSLFSLPRLERTVVAVG